MKTNASRRLASYLSAGVCVAVTEARADIVVTFYDNPAAYPSGISFGYTGASYWAVDAAGSSASIFAVHDGSRTFFDHPLPAAPNVGGVSSFGVWGGYYWGHLYGASPDADVYANISFDGDSTQFEAVGMFDLRVEGGPGKLLALAVSNDPSLSIFDGAAAIAAVPEPSGLLLGMLAVGAAGCRRRRNAVSPRQVSL